MKRILAPGALVVACAAAVAPMTNASATARPAADTKGPHSIALQSAGDMAALTSAAKGQTGGIAAALGLSADNTFTVTNVVKDADGATHTHVDRAYKGIPVLGGDLIIHRNAAGRITGHDGMWDKAVTVDLKPNLTVAQGSDKGLRAAQVHADHDGLNKATKAGTKLVILVDDQGAQHLGYQTQVNGFADDKTPSRIFSVVDADTGATLRAYDEIAHVQGSGQGIYDGSVTLDTTAVSGGYELRNPTTGNWTTDSHNIKSDGTIFTDADNRWGNGSNSDRASAGVDAQFGADKTVEYLKNTLNRNGIWDTGRGARSRVHYDTNYANAFWDGQQMTYGDGDYDAHPLTELDVAGHEMAHGVTGNSARLVYSGDAGGLNESTSDILGSGVEWYANIPSDTPDYMMGEKIDLRGNGTPLRWFDQPSKDGKSKDCWSTSVATLDPHYSSGPLNHWYYLASEGSGAKTINGVAYNSPTCNSSTVTGTGHEKVEKIWYRTLTTKLTSTSNYKAAREGAINSAIELYGASSQECASVEAAMNAIAVPAGTAKCTTGPGPIPGNSALVNGDFEAGQQGWTGTNGPITNDSRQPAHSGSYKMWLGGNGTTATESEEQTVTIPANGQLSFWLHIDTAEYTSLFKNDTMKVQLVDPSTQIAYTVASYSNLDKNTGYANKTISLANYAGKKMTLKFLMNENSSYQTSFVVDDVTLG